MATAGFDLSRPLSDILQAAEDAKALRARVAKLESQLEERDEEARLLAVALVDTKAECAALERALLLRGGTGKAPIPLQAFALALRFADVLDLGNAGCTCSDIHKDVQGDELWQPLCLQRLGAEHISHCHNFKALWISHRASVCLEGYQLEAAALQRFGLRNKLVVHWTITDARLQRCQNEDIYSPDFNVGDIRDCWLSFHPGGKRSPCRFFICMPQGTSMEAEVFIGDRTGMHIEHSFSDPMSRGWSDAGPRVSREKSLVIQVEFDQLYCESSPDDWIHIRTSKHD